MRKTVRRIVAPLTVLAAGAGLTLTGATPAAALGKLLQTDAVVCGEAYTGTYEDTYDNYPGDWVDQTGYRAYASCVKKSFVGAPNTRVRLVTSCRFGFTYYSEPKLVSSTVSRVEFITPGEDRTGCLFGVADYNIEKVS
ncbi:hypothetical protein [Streptomyces sp. NPDC005805]|uniref:hypothetical protein n=1 Tax=Streptomyces sp. NPDC005805 TaxID=3157068 RepID=UPI00340BE3C2